MDRLACISGFRLNACFSCPADGLKRCAYGMTLRSANMHNSSFFQILPHAQPRSVALNGWLAKPEDWLSERMKISTSQTFLINLKLIGNDY
ncbi:hypothetical protein HKD37_14G040669 [Glycine soja]